MNSSSTLAVALILFVSSFVSLVNFGLCSKSFDVFLFSQQWPESVCDSWLHKKGSYCNHYDKNMWTVHGVWPTRFGNRGPGYCDDHNQFDVNSISGIKNDLEHYWTSIHGGNTKFWSHEWNKHGTCATSVPELSTQTKYFRQGLEWAKKYNMADVLGAAGITPGQEYTVKNIRNGIKHVLNVNPQILCKMDEKHQSTIQEVRLCFDKSLELVDCDGTVVGNRNSGLLTNCRSRWVLYPESR